MRNVYDFDDDGDLMAAASEIAKIMKTEGWNVLRQRAEILRQEAAARALDQSVNRDELRGQIEGVFKLLDDAQALLARGVEAAKKGKQRAAERGGVFEAGGGQL